MKKEFLSKAKENLKIAAISLDHEYYNACANRAYFAAFQAAIAALISRGAERGKFDHKWVQAEFSRKLIKRQKIYPAKLKSYLLEMQIIRNRADYEQHHVNRKTAFKQSSMAEEMVRIIEKEIDK